MPHSVPCCAFAMLLVLIGLALGAPVSATEPEKEDPLPPPRALPPPLPQPAPILVPVFRRPSRYEVWQYHGVDRRGRFRPLVIASPHGPYYLHDGKPFPFALLYSLHWLPYVAH